MLVAFVMPVLLTIAGLGLDLGRLWLYSASLGNAADASALAGAMTAYCTAKVDGYGNIYSIDVYIDPFLAENECKTIFYENAHKTGMDNETVCIKKLTVSVEGMQVTVTSRISVKMNFLSLIGMEELETTRISTAECVVSLPQINTGNEQLGNQGLK